MTPEIVWLSRLLLGFLFGLSGGLKLLNFIRFRDTLAAMELFPNWLVRLAARSIPAVELAVGTAVLANFCMPIAGWILMALLGGFLLTASWYRLEGGRELVCGCFADFDQKTPTARIILRNALLLLAGLPLLSDRATAASPTTVHEWLLGVASVMGIMLGWILTYRLVDILGSTKALRAAEP